MTSSTSPSDAAHVVEGHGELVGPVEDVGRPPGAEQGHDHHQAEQDDEPERQQVGGQGRRDRRGDGSDSARGEHVAQDEQGGDDGRARTASALQAGRPGPGPVGPDVGGGHVRPPRTRTARRAPSAVGPCRGAVPGRRRRPSVVGAVRLRCVHAVLLSVRGGRVRPPVPCRPARARSATARPGSGRRPTAMPVRRTYEAAERVVKRLHGGWRRSVATVAAVPGMPRAVVDVAGSAGCRSVAGPGAADGGRATGACRGRPGRSAGRPARGTRGPRSPTAPSGTARASSSEHDSAATAIGRAVGDGRGDLGEEHDPGDRRPGRPRRPGSRPRRPGRPPAVTSGVRTLVSSPVRLGGRAPGRLGLPRRDGEERAHQVDAGVGAGGGVGGEDPLGTRCRAARTSAGSGRSAGRRRVWCRPGRRWPPLCPEVGRGRRDRGPWSVGRYGVVVVVRGPRPPIRPVPGVTSAHVQPVGPSRVWTPSV